MATKNHTHPHGTSTNVLKFGEGKKIIVDYVELERMFLHPEVKNRKVVVFSIIGAFRRGKSFFLDYCLRYLYAKYPSINFPTNPTSDPKNWMGEDTEPLQGFSWRSGIERDTTGIIMWSDVFLHTIDSTGDKIAIYVMDTQGLFDTKTSPLDNSRIFSLGTLISSIQILNLATVIQEDQLQYLQFATEFAKLASDDSKGTARKPFQNLWFLIRDWQNPDEFSFGIEGGREYLKNVLETKPDQMDELKSVREFILSSFENVKCCLLPHPGTSVARTKDFDGQWKLMEKDFKEELVIIIEHLLSPENLKFKKINGKDLNATEMKDYIESYFKLFESDTLPEALSLYQVTVENQMNLLIGQCVDSYVENISNTNQDSLTEDNLHLFHDSAKLNALTFYTNHKKMGNSEHEEKYRGQLDAKLEKLYVEWKDQTSKTLLAIKEERAKTNALAEAIKEEKAKAKAIAEAARKEKVRLQNEVLEAERIAKTKQEEIERLKLIEKAKYDAEIKEAHHQLELEKIRSSQKISELEKKFDSTIQHERQINEKSKEKEELKHSVQVLEKKLEDEKRQNEQLKSRANDTASELKEEKEKGFFKRVFKW